MLIIQSREFVLLILIWLFSLDVLADNCPTVMEVKYRLISTKYEWSVDEGVSLNDLISVNRLFSVSIENGGEFISCKYEYDNKFLKLDGIPAEKNCSISVTSGNWLTTKTGRSHCNEKETTLCQFQIDC